MTRKTSRRRFLKAAAATGALAGLNAAVLAQEKGDEVILLGGKVSGWQGWRLPGPKNATGSTNPTLTLDAGTTYTLMWQNIDGVPHNFAIQDKQGNNLKVLEPMTVQQELFSEINKTDENQTIDLNFSGNNVTGWRSINETGNVTGGNQTEGNMTGNQTEGNMTGNQTEQQTTLQSLEEKTEVLSEQGAVQGVRFTAEPKMAQYICLVHPNTMVGDINVKGGGAGNVTGNNSSG